MTVSEIDILKKLTDAIRDSGISPIPDTDFMQKRIIARIENREMNNSESKLRTLDSEPDLTSPVCFAKSGEIQSEYINGEDLLQQIDRHIDRLILSELL